MRRDIQSTPMRYDKASLYSTLNTNYCTYIVTQWHHYPAPPKTSSHLQIATCRRSLLDYPDQLLVAYYNAILEGKARLRAPSPS